jgi:hypothetical protein
MIEQYRPKNRKDFQYDGDPPPDEEYNIQKWDRKLTGWEDFKEIAQYNRQEDY